MRRLVGLMLAVDASYTFWAIDWMSAVFPISVLDGQAALCCELGAIYPCQVHPRAVLSLDSVRSIWSIAHLRVLLFQMIAQ